MWVFRMRFHLVFVWEGSRYSIWGFPKIGVGPQNGWWKSWKTLTNGWFWGISHHVRKHPHDVTYDLCHLQNFNDVHDQKDCTLGSSADPFWVVIFPRKNCRHPQGLVMSLPEGLVRSQLQAVADAEVQFLGLNSGLDDLDEKFEKPAKKWYKRNATSKNGWKITIFNRIHTSPNSVWICILLLLFVLTWTWSFLRRFWGVFLRYTRDIWRWNYKKSPEWVSCLGSCPTPRRKNYWLEPENQPKNKTFSGYQWRVFKNYTFEIRPCGLFIPPGWTYKPWNF